MINTLKVKSRMVELGIYQKDIAEELGLSLPTISQKLNNKRPIYLSEVLKLAKILSIDKTEFGIYFFDENVA